MMTIYAVKDCVVGEFQNIFVAHNDEAAVRIFSQSVNTTGHPVRSIYKDVQLYAVAQIDLVTGIVTSLAAPLFLCAGIDVYDVITIDLELYAKNAIKDAANEAIAKASVEIEKSVDLSRANASMEYKKSDESI